MKTILTAIILMATSTPFIDMKSDDMLYSTIAPIAALLGVILFILGLIYFVKSKSSSSASPSPKRFSVGSSLDGTHIGGGE
ncbi:hypothetical protein QWZ13_05720 [Reinekea marina]|uniref:Uncharacterized protein n=1 Tax=Reinekea marina TaxID=1310421 RepID=A0ABV7WP03_9GAMM|nr:hypothetical protein [Reinekea marina]MDN3648403.1 hypothetical protein [Reinekea marina]